MIIKYAVYVLVNLLVFAANLFWLLYMNTYFNERLIPKTLRAEYGMEMLARFLVANIESGFVAILMYLLNKKFTGYLFKDREQSFPLWTALATIGLVVIATGAAFYTTYRQGR